MSDCTEIYRLKLSTDRKKKDFFKSTGEYENNKKNLKKKQVHWKLPFRDGIR